MNGIQARSLTGEFNPFSPTAVARVAEFDETITVNTPAVRDGVRFLDEYLSSTSTTATQIGTPAQGNVMAIVGDYGTGKTHLAVELLHRARRSGGIPVHATYLDAPADTFVALYRRFVAGLRREDVLERVRDYYADVVADSLERSDLTSEVAAMLRDGEVDPVGIVEAFGLMDSVLLRRLQARLAAVTSNAAFATALTLLLRPNFQDAVWGWLIGNEPDPILLERGITTATDNEEAALEALGVFAMLYSGDNHRFILVVDELDKVLLAANRPTPAAVLAFKKMLTVFAGAGAFLIIAGLTDFLQVLGEDVKQRIGHIVEMSPLTGAEVRRFIADSQERILGTPQLAPFTNETVDYLVSLANGNPRKIIRLCYHVYRRAMDQGTATTEDMVRDVARTHFDFATIDDVRREVRRILDKEGLAFLRYHLVGSVSDLPVDYWIPVRDGSAGCAVLLTESVLNSGEATVLLDRALAVQRAGPDIEVLLVVVGYLPAELIARFSEALGTEPIVYDRVSFSEDFAGAVKATIRRLVDLTGDDSLVVIRERVERISRQQSNTQSFIEQLVAHLDLVRSAADRQLGTIQRDVDEISRAVYGGLDAPNEDRGEPPNPQRMPQAVAALFTNALDSLSELRAVDDLLWDAFLTRSRRPSEVTGARAAIRARLRQQDILLLLGVAVLLQKLVEAFRESVDDWHHSYSVDAQGRLRHSDEERLNTLCQSYDAIYEYLPLYRLDALSELAGGSDDADRVVELSQTVHRRDLRQTFDGLGARVRRAVMQSIGFDAA